MVNLADSVEFERGGFWRRALALLVDIVVVTVTLQLLALALFPLTNGRVQFVSGFALIHCDKLDAVPEGVSVPADFGANSITDCRHELFGLTSARVVTVAKVTRNGAITTTRQIGHLLDAQGKPIDGPTLDGLTLLFVFALRFGFDRSGRKTPGRRICGVRLSNAADGQFPPPASAVNRRYAAQVLPFVPLLVWPWVQKPLLGEAAAASIWQSMGSILPAVCVVAAVALALNAIIYRRDTWYDRFASTCILRLDKNQAPIPLAAAPSLTAETELASRQGLPEQAVADALGVEFSPPSLPPPLPKLASKNYLARHWYGELSLPKSYWVNAFLGNIIVGVAVIALAQTINLYGDTQPMLWMVSLITTWVIVALFTTWQAVGVWRSATRYKLNGNRFWGGIAKTVIVLGVLNTAYRCLFVATPQLAGIYEIVSGDARVGPHQFHVLENGSMLEFSGGITFGVARELESFLDAMGNVRTVRLDSVGGRILEAQKMSDMVRARGLSTYVAQDCLSACTIVFLGGKDRLMLPTARLGFHQPAFRGMTVADRRLAIANEEARLQRFGLSQAFAVRANSAMPSGMWYPDKGELLREKVVTRIVVPPPPNPAPANQAAASAPATGANAAPPASSAAAPTAAPLVVRAPDPPLSTDAGTYETGRARIPADLMKRLSTPPKKPAAVPQAAGATAATGEQK